MPPSSKAPANNGGSSCPAQSPERAFAAECLGCAPDELTQFEAFSEGMNNENFAFAHRGQAYLLRRPFPYADARIDRQAEAEAEKIASSLGIDTSFICLNPTNGYKLSRLIEGAHELDYFDENLVIQAFSQLKALHSCKHGIARAFDHFQAALDLEQEAQGLGAKINDAGRSLRGRIARLSQALKAQGKPTVLCHNDFYGPNILISPEGACIIDWEYAAMGDGDADFGSFIAQGPDLDPAFVKRLMSLYLGTEPSCQDSFRLYAATAIVGWYWYCWALVREARGGHTGDWKQRWLEAACRYSMAANRCEDA